MEIKTMKTTFLTPRTMRKCSWDGGYLSFFLFWGILLMMGREGEGYPLSCSNGEEDIACGVTGVPEGWERNTSWQKVVTPIPREQNHYEAVKIQLWNGRLLPPPFVQRWHRKPKLLREDCCNHFASQWSWCTPKMLPHQYKWDRLWVPNGPV